MMVSAIVGLWIQILTANNQNNMKTLMDILIGVLGSVIAATLFPVLGAVAGSVAVRLLGWLPIRGRADIAGNWISVWIVNSQRYPHQVQNQNTVVRQLGNRVFIRFSVNEAAYLAEGRIDDSRYVTGTWGDRNRGGYHGAFQLVIDPMSRDMRGVWVGFSTDGTVKHGNWNWTRVQ